MNEMEEPSFYRCKIEAERVALNRTGSRVFARYSRDALSWFAGTETEYIEMRHNAPGYNRCLVCGQRTMNELYCCDPHERLDFDYGNYKMKWMSHV